MCQKQCEPVLLSACQTVLTCLPLTENDQRLIGCSRHLKAPLR